MRVETVTIHRTFRVVRHEWKGRKWTDFGFEISGRTVYSARVLGHPDIREAMHVTLVMPAADSWANICGWFDHIDGSIHIEANGQDWGFVGAFLFGVCLAMFNLVGQADELATGQIVGFSVILTTSLFGLIYFGVRLGRKLRTARLLGKLFPDARRNAS